MFNKHDISRDACQLFGAQASKGYDWWWHSFTGYDAETGAASHPVEAKQIFYTSFGLAVAKIIENFHIRYFHIFFTTSRQEQST